MQSYDDICFTMTSIYAKKLRKIKFLGEEKNLKA